MKINILATGKFRVKAGADLDQCSHPATDRDLAAGGRSDTRQDFHDRGLARPIVSDNSERFAFVYLEAHVAQRPHLPGFSPKPPRVPPLWPVAIAGELVLLRYSLKLQVNHCKITCIKKCSLR